jgi:thiamine pyrophosphokinase
MKTALIANGEITNPLVELRDVHKFDQIIAVDGGLNYCHKVGIKPHLIIGDLDSVHADFLALYPHVPKITVPEAKDETDLEIAIKHVLTSATEIVVFGALGGRTDHTLYNLNLLSRYPGKIIYEAEHELVMAIDKKAELKTFVGQILSFLPLNGPVLGVMTKGLRWELVDATFDKNFMSVCNEALKEKVEINFTEGDLLCFLQF